MTSGRCSAGRRSSGVEVANAGTTTQSGINAGIDEKPGVVFLMSAESVDEAKAIVGEMPLAAAGFLDFEFLPVGPLKPLGMLLQGK
ncbi:hypothetical protein [Trinickia symbiotica]|uniref:hypothetical protein n=1 Tax=Trinickia symbiotica TaxID=863227 RepID=UPI00039E49C0|nr:hypothetical protein [Trinickia symbiotica]